MTTRLTKPVSRVTVALHRGKQVVVTINPNNTLGFRFKGERTNACLDIGAAFDYAVKVEVGFTPTRRKK